MTQDLDRLFERLNSHAMPGRLNDLEADVARKISGLRAASAPPAWRSVAVTLALAAGLGIGGSATAWSVAGEQPDDLLSGVRLAPSSLLANSE